MPRVPYNSVPDISPQSPGEQINVATPGAAFGENIGAALKQVGGSVETAGNELYTRALAIQELKNQADAREAQTNYAEQSAMLQQKFDSLEGKASQDQLQTHLQSLKDLRQQIRGGLSSPMAQQHFDSDSLPFYQRMVFTSAARAGEQFKNYIVGTAQATADFTSRNYVNPNDDLEFQGKIRQIDDAGETIAGAKGWSDPELADWKLKQKSLLWAGRVESIARTDPQSALAMLVQNKTAMTQQDYDKVTNHVRSQNRAIGSRVLGDSIWGDGSKSLTQMFEEAKTKSPDYAHDDPLFEHDVESYLHTKFVDDKSAQTQQVNSAIDTIWKDGIMAGSPKSVAELLALPGMQTAYNSLPTEKQRLIPQWLNQWASAKNKLANESEYNRLRGLAITDPAEFLNSSPSTWNVSGNQQVQLLGLRQKLTKNAETDPRVVKAIGFMRRNYGAELTSLGIYTRNANSPDDYDHYVGALESSIDEWTQVHGKPPSNTEMLDIGKDVIKTHPQPGFFGLYTAHGPFGSDKPRYDIPQNVLDSVKADLQKSVPDVTDDEVYRASLRQIFKELYGGSSTRSATQPGQ